MDSFSLFITIVAAAIGLFTLFRKLRFHLASSSPPSSLNRILTYDVFPSFRGEDVRGGFLSHFLVEFNRKGITLFIDNEIERGEFISPALIRAIKESKIAIILLSMNYASSRWCLDELAEIMKCMEEFGQLVIPVFYKVEPSDVKKLNGVFGEVFRKTCVGKTKQDIRRWNQALEKVSTLAGYHLRIWDDEAATITKIVTHISNKLYNSAPSSDLDRLVGMETHLEKMEQLLSLDSDEVRIVGLLGPPGIGKTTIARAAYNKHSQNFQMNGFMEPIEANYSRPSSDEYSPMKCLQEQFLSTITNQKDIKVSHLGGIKDRLKDRKVFVVLDGVDRILQLDAMAQDNSWFGPGSRIIVTSQNLNLLNARRIKLIYKVGFPSTDEALQIFCMHAFCQNSPKDGFEELAREVTELVGELPLGLRVMGSYFRGISSDKQAWTDAIRSLRSSGLETDIYTILKFSYDALREDEKLLFLYIACFFNHEQIKKVEAHLEESMLNVSYRLNVLAEKSLISISERGYISMHTLLVQLGKDIVGGQPRLQPRKRQFLDNPKDICSVLIDDAAGSRNVIGIDLNLHKIERKIYISEKALQGMTNLQFLRIYGDPNKLHLPNGFDSISSHLRLLHWTQYPITRLPSNFHTLFLVELNMPHSKLEKLWEGYKPLPSLMWMDLSYSVNLMEVPDLSTATSLLTLNLSYCSSLMNLTSSIGNAVNLQTLDLSSCSSLRNLPPSIGNAKKLQKLDLRSCSKLKELPSSIGDAKNLQKLDLRNCSGLKRLPSTIGNAQNLQKLDLSNCSEFEDLPSSIGNAKNLQALDLRNCSSLVVIPSSIGNAENLQTLDLRDCSRLISVPSSIGNAKNLQTLDLRNCIHLAKNVPSSFENVKNLRKLYIHNCSLKELSLGNTSNLEILSLYGCSSLVELDVGDKEEQAFHAWDNKMSRLKMKKLQHISDPIFFEASCEPLERLHYSFQHPDILLNFAKCFELNQEARDLIILAQTSKYAVLPGGEVPAYFTHRVTGGSLTIKLSEMLLPTSMRFKACISLVSKGRDEYGDCHGEYGDCDRKDSFFVKCGKTKTSLSQLLNKHLYIFEVEADVTSGELVFEFKVCYNHWTIKDRTIEEFKEWKIGECGILQVSEVPS